MLIGEMIMKDLMMIRIKVVGIILEVEFCRMKIRIDEIVEVGIL